MKRSVVVVALGGILAVYFALFAPSRNFDFVWSDGDLIRDSAVFTLPLAKALRTTEHARWDPSVMELQGIVLTHEGYRPLLILDHALDMRLFGPRARPMHLHNLVLGALGIFAAYWLALLLLGRAAPALVVAAIFAWHPFHVEAICFLTARADPLTGLFALLAAALVVETAPIAGAARSPGAARWLAVGAGLFMFLSVLSKEANLLLPLALVGFGLATGRLRAWLGGIAALVVAIVAYAGLRALIIPQAPAATHANRITHAVLALPAIVSEYARSFLLPFDMSISRPVYASLALGWGLLVVATIVAVVAMRRAPASWRPAVALAAASVWSAGVLIGPAAIAVFSEAAVADRYAYLAVFAFAMALVTLGARVAAKPGWPQRSVYALAAAFLLLCIFVSAREVPAWATSDTLYAHAVDVEPDSAAAHNRLGRLWGEQRDWSKAVVEFERAAALPGGDVDRVLNNLGVGYLNLGRLPDAERVLRHALARSGGTSYHAWYNLATVQRLLGEGDASCDSYRRALAVSPAYAHARADQQRYCPAVTP